MKQPVIQPYLQREEKIIKQPIVQPVTKKETISFRDFLPPQSLDPFPSPWGPSDSPLLSQLIRHFLLLLQNSLCQFVLLP